MSKASRFPWVSPDAVVSSREPGDPNGDFRRLVRYRSSRPGDLPAYGRGDGSPRGINFGEQINAPERNTKEAHRGTVMSPSARSLAIAFALVIVVVLAPAGTGAPSDGTTRIRWTSGFGGRSFEARGSVEFTGRRPGRKDHF